MEELGFGLARGVEAGETGAELGHVLGCWRTHTIISTEEIYSIETGRKGNSPLEREPSYLLPASHGQHAHCQFSSGILTRESQDLKRCILETRPLIDEMIVSGWDQEGLEKSLHNF